ncbi:helix-turn-helix transcriptional regulator [Budviciaceae bacterium CWB-B4]|uniref:Helix-turn-helix transcriptional regulator n=1 Tax=Limnobaculum xujianqingii TaxID=2738837 RepID=A0A9D7AH18_9GAMM|nr:helix-turn-helix transcriptional regulator [Limnobaculum xujianqingii]MBK5072536.1 helix-turn-helix transcriptional regulator [Limnobaculum xujianqingii]MBK5175845.1 helix-turn-helix transcriptional regulator [Limnobaculum xujianqingii]
MEKTEKTVDVVKRFIPMPGINRFPERLKIAMNGLTNVELAKRCDISESAIRSYLSGRSYPGLDKVLSISEACTCPVDWLVTGNELAIYSENNAGKSSEKYDSREFEEINIVFNRLTQSEKKLIVDFVQREGLNSLLRLISERTQIGTHYNQLSIDASDSSAPWVDDKMRSQLKETLIDMGFDRKRISTISMLFSLPEEQAREILSQYATNKHDGSSQDAINNKQDHKKKAG